MTKFGPGSRATFISPYLRRPLRSLNKVLSERDDQDDAEVQQQSASDAHHTGSSTWGRMQKSVAASD
ncbi:hypothetical protein AAFN88_15395 [Pelagibius sp. CAU 1746]|uniref:hypothetical protein n=1 Tax=Pelagibius sp. CAU 1746 TaxID=3140370 RepID=UPI00325BA94C